MNSRRYSMVFVALLGLLIPLHSKAKEQQKPPAVGSQTATVPPTPSGTSSRGRENQKMTLTSSQGKVQTQPVAGSYEIKHLYTCSWKDSQKPVNKFVPQASPNPPKELCVGTVLCDLNAQADLDKLTTNEWKAGILKLATSNKPEQVPEAQRTDAIRNFLKVPAEGIPVGCRGDLTQASRCDSVDIYMCLAEEANSDHFPKADGVKRSIFDLKPHFLAVFTKTGTIPVGTRGRAGAAPPVRTNGRGGGPQPR